MSPLAADLAAAVEQISVDRPGIGGKAGAFGQAFSLLNCGISAGVLAGPVLAGSLHEQFGWKVMGWSLAVLSASAVVPIESCPELVLCLVVIAPLSHHPSMLISWCRRALRVGKRIDGREGTSSCTNDVPASLLKLRRSREKSARPSEARRRV